MTGPPAGLILSLLAVLPHSGIARAAATDPAPLWGPGARGPAARDRVYVAAGDGWRLERFGDRVALLSLGFSAARSHAKSDARPDARSNEGAGRAGSLVLSCEGREGRWRLRLPEAVAPAATPLRALVRAYGPDVGRDDYLLSTLIVGPDGATLVPRRRADPGSDVRDLARLLARTPRGVEVLLRPLRAAGDAARVGIPPIRLELPRVPAPDGTFGDFLSVCAGGR